MTKEWFGNEKLNKTERIKLYKEKSLFERDDLIKNQFNDEAEKWLLENDPHYVGLGVFKEKSDNNESQKAA